MIILICVSIFVVVGSFPHTPAIEKIGVIYTGPGSSVIIKGPDGSLIKADAVGGSISVKDFILTESSGSAVSSVLTGEKESTENTASTDDSTVTEEITQNTHESSSETTTSNEEISTDTTEIASSVTTLEPTTLPSTPSEGKDIKLKRQATENNFTIVVTEPVPVSSTDLNLQTKAPEEKRKKIPVTLPQLVLERIPNAPAFKYLQPTGEDWITPGIYDGPINKLEWSLPSYSIFL